MMKRSMGRESMAWTSATAAAALLGLALLPLCARPAAAQPETARSCVDRCVNGKDCATNPYTPCVPHLYRTDAPVGSEDFPFDDFIQILPQEGTDTLRLFITADGTNSDGPNDGNGDTGGGKLCVAGPGGIDSDHLCAFRVILDIPEVCRDFVPEENRCVTGSPLISPGRFVRFVPDASLDSRGQLVTVPPEGVFDPGVTSFGINFVNPNVPLEPGPMDSAGPASPSSLVEDFEADFPAWESGWLGTNSNLANVYAGPSGGTSSDRGNNPDGLWLSDGDGESSDSVVDIAFDPIFGASLTSLSLDIAGHVSLRLQIYDIAGVTLLDVNPIEVTFGATTDPGSYVNYGATSTNGIGGFRMLQLAGVIEGNTGIDNVVVNADAIPETVAVVHELGLLDVEVFDPRIVVWVRQGDAIRSASAKAVDTAGSQTLHNVLEDRMSPHAIAISLPEPGAYLSLFTTLAGLGGLHRLRLRRQARRARSEP
jgi:hypothetical protein